MEATPGLAQGGNEFYSVAGAERLAEMLPGFSEGRAIVGVCGVWLAVGWPGPSVPLRSPY